MERGWVETWKAYVIVQIILCIFGLYVDSFWTNQAALPFLAPSANESRLLTAIIVWGLRILPIIAPLILTRFFSKSWPRARSQKTGEFRGIFFTSLIVSLGLYLALLSSMLPYPSWVQYILPSLSIHESLQLYDFLTAILSMDILVLQVGIEIVVLYGVFPEAVMTLSQHSDHIRLYLVGITVLVHSMIAFLAVSSVMPTESDIPFYEAAIFAGVSLGSFISASFLFYEVTGRLSEALEEYIVGEIETILLTMREHVILFNSPDNGFESLPFTRGICDRTRQKCIWMSGEQFSYSQLVKIPIQTDIVLFEDMGNPLTRDILFIGESKMFGQVYIRRIRVQYDKTSIVIGVERSTLNQGSLGMLNERKASLVMALDPSLEGFESWREHLENLRDSDALRIVTALRATDMIQTRRLARQTKAIFVNFLEGYVAIGKQLTLSVISKLGLFMDKTKLDVLCIGGGQKLRYAIQALHVNATNMDLADRIRISVVTNDEDIIGATSEKRVLRSSLKQEGPLETRYSGVWQIPIEYQKKQLHRIGVDVIQRNLDGPDLIGDILKSVSPDVVLICSDNPKQNTMLLHDVTRYIDNHIDERPFDIVAPVSTSQLDEIYSLVGSSIRNWAPITIDEGENTPESLRLLFTIGTRLLLPVSLTENSVGSIIQSMRGGERYIRCGNKTIRIMHSGSFHVAYCVSDQPGALEKILSTSCRIKERGFRLPRRTVSLKNVFAQNCPRAHTFRDEHSSANSVRTSHFTLSAAVHFMEMKEEVENYDERFLVRAGCNIGDGRPREKEDWGTNQISFVDNELAVSRPLPCNRASFCRVAYCRWSTAKSTKVLPKEGNNEQQNTPFWTTALEDGGAEIKVCMKNLPGATALCQRLLLLAASGANSSSGEEEDLRIDYKKGTFYGDISYVSSFEDLITERDIPTYLEICGSKCTVDQTDEDVSVSINELVDAILVMPKVPLSQSNVLEKWDGLAENMRGILGDDFTVERRFMGKTGPMYIVRKLVPKHLCDDLTCAIAKRNLGIHFSPALLKDLADFVFGSRIIEHLLDRSKTADNVDECIDAIKSVMSGSNDSLRSLLAIIERYKTRKDVDELVDELDSKWIPQILLSQDDSWNPSAPDNVDIDSHEDTMPSDFRGLSRAIRQILEYVLINKTISCVSPIFIEHLDRETEYKDIPAGAVGNLIKESHPCVSCAFPCSEIKSMSWIEQHRNKTRQVSNVLNKYDKNGIPKCIEMLGNILKFLAKFAVQDTIKSTRRIIEKYILPFDSDIDNLDTYLDKLIIGTNSILKEVFSRSLVYYWREKPPKGSLEDMWLHDEIIKRESDYLSNLDVFSDLFDITEEIYPFARSTALSEVLRLVLLVPYRHYVIYRTIGEEAKSSQATPARRPISPLKLPLKTLLMSPDE